MDNLNWKMGLRPEPPSPMPSIEMERLQSVLSNQRSRSRLLRDLELQSIANESVVEHFHRLHDEEMLPGRAHGGVQNADFSARNL